MLGCNAWPIFKAGALAMAVVLAACGGSDDTQPPIVQPGPSPAPVMYALTFDANGATGESPPPARIDYAAGQSAPIPKGELSLTGYMFDSWNTQADGFGAHYMPGSTLVMPAREITLYAQWKAVPLKITQQGSGDEIRLLIEWHDGSKQDFVYSRNTVGLGSSYDLNPIVGGLAILLSGNQRYIHTCYPIDYLPGHQAKMVVTSGSDTILEATSPNGKDRSGLLSPIGATSYANEIKVVVTGRIIDANADTEVEIILRADTPRMLLTRSRISYTRLTHVQRLYHQLVHANPVKLFPHFNYLYGIDGRSVEGSSLSSNMESGLFYTSDQGYYVGFLSTRDGSNDFLAWNDGDYFASYKILYDNVLKQPGDQTESRGVSTWGYSGADARQLMSWADELRQGKRPIVAVKSHSDRAVVRMLSDAFGVR